MNYKALVTKHGNIVWRVGSDGLSISNPFAANTAEQLITAPWGEEKGLIVSQDLSPDESILAVACLCLPAVHPTHPLHSAGFDSEKGSLRVTLIEMPAGSRLHQVSAHVIPVGHEFLRPVLKWMPGKSAVPLLVLGDKMWPQDPHSCQQILTINGLTGKSSAFAQIPAQLNNPAPRAFKDFV
ncbi:hypothetical protein WJX74_002976 [Apatococcus lobatus]|uniref:Uncharacterized protein n=1 Tax=Apatococcus lobatus TaxID=904363 RepID=A0AAW1RFX7_9CHLO